MKFTWHETSGKSNWILAIIALLATMVFIDGLMLRQFLRPLAGLIVAAVFWTLTFKGVPIPTRVVNSVEEQFDRAASVQPGANSDAFRWIMVVLGAVLGALALLGAYAILSASPDSIESYVAPVARDIRRARGSGWEMLVRLGYAALFLVCAAALLFTAWKRAKG